MRKLQKYIKKYYYKFDGLRCYHHAMEINDYINNYNEKYESIYTFFMNEPKYLWLYMKTKIRRPLYLLRKILLENILHEHNPEDIIADPSIKIDNRGRFDNRIKEGDEEYWFNKFEQAGFKVEDFEEYLADMSGNM